VVLVEVAFWVMALICALTGIGVYGLIAVEAKTPLVTPNGPIIVTFIYALLWSASLVFALVFSTVAINYFIGGDIKGNGQEVPKFFINTTLVLFLSARSSRSALATTSDRLERTLVCLVAFAIFSARIPFLDSQWQTGLTAALVNKLQETVRFPIELISALLSGGIWGLIKQAYQWLHDVGGNLFLLSPILAKLFWIGAVVNAVLAWFQPKAEQKEPIGGPLTDEELSNFGMAILLVLSMAACAAIMHYLPGTEFAWWKPLLLFASPFGFLLAYFALVLCLFGARG
jgi:hypothetical protein